VVNSFGYSMIVFFCCAGVLSSLKLIIVPYVGYRHVSISVNAF